MWGDADTAIGGNRDRFPSTQLSLIEAAAGEPLALERVAEWRLERAIGVRALVGEQSVAVAEFRTETEKAAFAAEPSALQTHRPHIRHALSRAKVHHTQAAARTANGGLDARIGRHPVLPI